MNTIRRNYRRILAACLFALVAVVSTDGFAQTRVRPGFNLFSAEQDVEVGRQSAAEAERQLPILNDRTTTAYINAIGKRLTVEAPGADYPYQFKVVNASDINAFALPGGFLYLNRGMIEAARTEDQLAGVMAHEIAHVALRHGTNQASKAYLGQAGLGILGGLVSKDNRSTGKILGVVGGFGLNTLFLKFSRSAEEQADVVGAQMLAKAGYDPMGMVTFFEMLADKRNREPSKVEQFFSSHPSPGNRAERIRNEMKELKVRSVSPVGGLDQVKADLRSMPPAPTMKQIAEGQTSDSGSRRQGDGRVASIEIERPSSQFRSFSQRRQFFEIDYPDNWRTYESQSSHGVTIAPEGGIVDNGGQEEIVVYGVIINHYDPFDGGMGNRFYDRSGPVQGSTSLAQATNDLVEQILNTNRHLEMMKDSERRDSIDGAPALTVVLSGRSPTTRQEERVTVFTRELSDDHIIYALFIAPGQDYDELRKTFNRIISSLRVNDSAAHR